MAQSKEDATVSFINRLIALGTVINSQKGTIDAAVDLYNKEGFSAIWNAFPTCALNADGSLGAADGSPITTHPVDTRIAAVSAIQKAVTPTALTNVIVAFQQLQNFFGNIAVVQGNYQQSFDDVAL